MRFQERIFLEKQFFIPLWVDFIPFWVWKKSLFFPDVSGFESLLLDRCLRQSLIIFRLFWVFADRQVFASEHSGVSLLCTWSILCTVMETLEDGIHCGRLLEEIWVVCDEDRINYLVNFYSKSNQSLISIFTVIVIDLVAMPYCQTARGDAIRCTGHRSCGCGNCLYHDYLHSLSLDHPPMGPSDLSSAE
jgi:hypothetical protein